MRRHPKVRRALRLPGCAAALVLAAGCAGCSDYLARRDTLSLASGDAVQANLARHVIDPWPLHARRVDSTTDGERLQHAMERYRNPPGAAGGAGAAVGTSPYAPVGTPAPPPSGAPGFR